jgi:hypothetical protein
LAFLLALLDLILELQGTGGRKRRETFENQVEKDSTSFEELEKNSTLASYSIFRGFLNSMDAEMFSCTQKYFCEATFEAGKYGQIGQMIARISR